MDIFVLFYLIYFNLFPTLPTGVVVVVVASCWWCPGPSDTDRRRLEVVETVESLERVELPPPPTSTHLLPAQPGYNRYPGHLLHITVITVKWRHHLTSLIMMNDDARYQVRDIIAQKNISLVLPPEIYIDGEILV